MGKDYYLTFSDKIPRIVRDRLGSTHGFEVFYNIEVTRWLHITPDFQIIKPANKSLDTAYIAGVRVRIDL